MLEILSNGRVKDVPVWITNKPGTMEDLKEALVKYTLDPRFEEHGNFINNNPHWLKPELQEKYNNCTVIFGNFFNYSHVFNIITDDEKLISDITELVEINKSTELYKQAKLEYENEKRMYEENRMMRLSKNKNII